MPPESPTNTPRVSIGWAPSFAVDVSKLDEEIGHSASTGILTDLTAALGALRRFEWDEMVITPFGHLGSSFQYDFHPHYVFTFSVLTDRDEQKKPIKENYILKRLLKK